MLASTPIVGMGATRAGCTGQLTQATTDQAAQQILMGVLVARRHLPVVRQVGLHQVKLLLADDRWHVPNDHPFVRWGGL